MVSAKLGLFRTIAHLSAYRLPATAYRLLPFGFVCTTGLHRPAVAGRREASRSDPVPNPQSAIEQLALFFRTPCDIQILITLCVSGSYDSKRPWRNWVCFARLPISPPAGYCHLGSFRRIGRGLERWNIGYSPRRLGSFVQLSTGHRLPTTAVWLCLACSRGSPPQPRSVVSTHSLCCLVIVQVHQSHVKRNSCQEKRRFRGDTRWSGSIPGTGPQTRYFAFGNPWPPSERTFPAGARSGSGPERLPTDPGRKASPRIRRRCPAPFPKSWLRPPMGGLKSFRP